MGGRLLPATIESLSGLVGLELGLELGLGGDKENHSGFISSLLKVEDVVRYRRVVKAREGNHFTLSRCLHKN